MCEAKRSCVLPSKYWVQGIANHGNVLTCGVHLASTVELFSKVYMVDVTVKTKRSLPVTGREVWGFPTTHSRVQHN